MVPCYGEVKDYTRAQRKRERESHTLLRLLAWTFPKKCLRNLSLANDSRYHFCFFLLLLSLQRVVNSKAPKNNGCTLREATAQISCVSLHCYWSLLAYVTRSACAFADALRRRQKSTAMESGKAKAHCARAPVWMCVVLLLSSESDSFHCHVI